MLGENDVKLASSDKKTILIGFNVELDRVAQDAKNNGLIIEIFSIIYKLSEWLTEQTILLRPKFESEKVVGSAKIIKTFSSQKQEHLLGDPGRRLDDKIL